MTTLTEAKAYLRVDTDDEDALITTLIDVCTAAALDYLGVPAYDDENPMPAPVGAAILLQVGDLYEHRERQSEKPYYANLAYERLLNPYRAMAV